MCTGSFVESVLNAVTVTRPSVRAQLDSSPWLRQTGRNVKRACQPNVADLGASALVGTFKFQTFSQVLFLVSTLYKNVKKQSSLKCLHQEQDQKVVRDQH